MSELSEAEWMAKIAEAMGCGLVTIMPKMGEVAAHTEPNKHFSILTNPADCLAAIKHFHLEIIWEKRQSDSPEPAINYLHDGFSMEWVTGEETLEQSAFEACKKIVGSDCES